jgi:hypothetical protein
MFNIELIRKMFAYEHIYKKFDRADFKFLLGLDDNYGNQVKFKNWIDENDLINSLKDWLKEYKLEKTFPEVYVATKTDTEMFVEFLYEHGKDISEKDRAKILKEHVEKEKKKNKDMFK